MSRGSVSGRSAPTSTRSWTIDELAALVGVPTRTVREYRTRGLIDPPDMAGRVGRYGETHRVRLELIGRLQDRGYSLAAIGDLCGASASGRSLDDVLGTASSVVIDDAARSYSTDELIDAVNAFTDADVRSAAMAAELIFDDGGRWLVRAPALLELVGTAIAAGADPFAAIRMAAGLIRGARAQADAFADLVAGELWDEHDPDLTALVSVGRRARLQLTRSVAALVVHEVGRELRTRASRPGGRGLDDLVDELRIGLIR